MINNNEFSAETAIIGFYLKFLEENRRDPSVKEFTNYLEPRLVDKDGNPFSWKKVYKNVSQVRIEALKNHSQLMESLVFNDESLSNEEYALKRDEAIRTHTRFVISTAVNTKPANIEFLNALKNYADRRNAVLLWLPSHDVKNAKKTFEWEFDPALKCGYVITSDTVLNNNLMISGITTSAKQRNPLTGVSRFTSQYEKSIVFPGCKQMQENIATQKDFTPHMATTPGAVTVPDYSCEQLIAGRTNYIAERDHQAGAVIVEIENDRRFHLRLIQATDDGSFTDLGTCYHADGTTSKSRDAVLVCGDSHAGNHNIELFKTVLDLLRDSSFVTTMVLHDLCNSSAVSHHEANDIITRVLRVKDGTDLIENEVTEMVKYLNNCTELSGMDVVVVNSNHDRHIDRYIKEARFAKDTRNLECALELASAMIKNPNLASSLQYLAENKSSVKLNKPHRIKWLKLDESYKRYGVELGVHGDLGVNGSRGSMLSYEKALYNAVVAHSHSAAVLKKIFRVGTLSNKDMGYNHGLSSWTHTCCLVYEDGTKQLINFIPNEEGKFTYHA